MGISGTKSALRVNSGGIYADLLCYTPCNRGLHTFKNKYEK